MRIGVIGAGFVGLSAAFSLAEKGHEVVVLEKDSGPGGLARGFIDSKWKWHAERHYHHFFVSDWSIRNFAEKVGCMVPFYKATTSTWYRGKSHKIDSLVALLRFPHLSLFDKLRTILVLAYLRLTPFWRPLERITSARFLKRFMGKRSWEVLWEPLFSKKFGRSYGKIPASWFWARIKKRSARLGYPVGGFQRLAEKIARVAKRSGVRFVYKTETLSIEKVEEEFRVETTDKGEYVFDRVICTLPTFLLLKITKGLPNHYKKKGGDMRGIGAVNLVLSLKESFLTDGTYWLNINEKGFPFLAVVEHTNLINRKNYGGDRILYVGNYLDPSHVYFSKSARELLLEFAPYLKKINPGFSLKMVRKAWVFTAPFAQPVIPLDYSRKILPLTTPIRGLYLANMQQVYPWDRGTNYAVSLGEKVAGVLLDDNLH
ncbi:MAG: hypothetical protein A2700_00625 [Candidatus Blackburnbacteria bacterium RIFCSPHIGHO2_01_FULL_44_64]|uniref:Amine oxidase domain-containing protein n=1 Tax=Candidatus Blackburnbacteria bacterium RIFCSPHIGHO2_02_FULL_44_20 TaxID=1797516 RepID=A0A1G1V633_9BACT|nr:MAG: hypothetical protein A2700_00625 [Candidatus Blackburnbacteria bacterium RIFCSPHIGHO2_01_FULL_44_64]OGY10817.1 MAG: hypothetical protein A3D26_01515 [Candidatus Blackburnbacteria bacterium RIFCSPHIGHO2_02_FULL_44_20]OGY10831.1 MAG: hypothetical protein A3E16_04040 [Candidatus Blackburnbacteria bacterium RIFCSPHIGHO2_12_FULL_44_25]OGY15146.1 MAG: hypothetical protein A3A62_03150 [Candidatus Blackburnbacteria bacterium RIFCSPLOWO2_01_FULL_44_43]OGY16394.1 MAG: hypothetical protein A3H88_0